MPGIAGYIGSSAGKVSPKLLSLMAQEMVYAPMQLTDCFEGYAANRQFGVTRVHHGLPDPMPQPIWNEARSMCIIMHGELFGYQLARRTLIEKGHHFRTDSAAEFALHLYEEVGDAFALQLNGSFSIAIWQQPSGELLLVNGRMGLRPLYYAHYNDHFAFSSRMGSLLADPALPREVDPVALTELLSFEYVLGNRTNLRHVHLLPPASILRYVDGQVSIHPYWTLRFGDYYPQMQAEEYVEELIPLLHQAAMRQAPGSLPAGINLSGGLDSRVAIGLLSSQNGSHPLRAYTFGIPGCDDAKIASQLAQVAGVDHAFYELRPDALLDYVDLGVRLTDGMESCVHMHALAHAQRQSKDVSVLYTGYLLDSLLSADSFHSPDIMYEWLAAFDDEHAAQTEFAEINSLFPKHELDDLLDGSLRSAIDVERKESYRTTLFDMKSHLFLDWMNRFDMVQRQRRFTQNGNEMIHAFMNCRTIFCDNDLLDFGLKVPAGLRAGRWVLKQAFQRMHHPLAKVTYDKTGLPMTKCMSELAIRSGRHLRHYLRKFGVHTQTIPAGKPYADYNSWLRGALRSWAESILLDPRTLKRGYFNPEKVRDLVGKHMAGANLSRELGMLLSIELWHRQVID